MTDNRWYPHLDYAGEPLDPGKFRDEQPTNPKEVTLRNAAIIAVERFCESLGVAMPPLGEHGEQVSPSTWRCTFIGELPDGHRLGIGYEVFEAPGQHPLCNHALEVSAVGTNKMCTVCGDIFDERGEFLQATQP